MTHAPDGPASGRSDPPLPEASGIREQHIEVVRTARYATLGRPGTHVGQVWFVLHGYRQLASRFLRRFDCLDDGSRLVVAPEGLSRFYLGDSGGRHGPEHRVGATWMTREDRENEIRDYVRYLDALAQRLLPEVPLARRVVLGFSQGVHTAARWVTLGETRVHRLVLWGAYLPPDLDMEAAAPRLRTLRLTFVEGTDDGSADADLRRDQEERLSLADVRWERLTHPGGHRIDQELVLRIAGEDATSSGTAPG